MHEQTWFGVANFSSPLQEISTPYYCFQVRFHSPTCPELRPQLDETGTNVRPVSSNVPSYEQLIFPAVVTIPRTLLRVRHRCVPTKLTKNNHRAEQQEQAPGHRPRCGSRSAGSCRHSCCLLLDGCEVPGAALTLGCPMWRSLFAGCVHPKERERWRVVKGCTHTRLLLWQCTAVINMLMLWPTLARCGAFTPPVRDRETTRTHCWSLKVKHQLLTKASA